jgi:hypothetical protein
MSFENESTHGVNQVAHVTSTKFPVEPGSVNPMVLLVLTCCALGLLALVAVGADSAALPGIAAVIGVVSEGARRHHRGLVGSERVPVLERERVRDNEPEA